MRALLLVEVEPLALVAAHAEFAETKSLTTKHTKKDTKGTKKTERATTRGTGHETKSASQTQTRYGEGLCVCETLYVSLAAGCAGRRRARVSAGFAVSAFNRRLLRGLRGF